MRIFDKLLHRGGLRAWREIQRRDLRRVVVTNGCFDILHAGHAAYLEAARDLGDVLLVGLNSDQSVRRVKGPSRPWNVEADRAFLLAAMAAVDSVCLFHELTAERFLAEAAPDVWVKGGDYTLDTLNQEERHIVEDSGGVVVIAPLRHGVSTSGLIQKLETDCWLKNGRGGEIRTHDLLYPKQAR